MKEYPIIFSSAMIRAILNGSKTQTRRIILPWPDAWIRGSDGTFKVPMKKTNKKPGANRAIWQEDDGTCYETMKCPYGQEGDRLWVRESWAQQLSGKFIYKADYPDGFAADQTATGAWKPSIHMPRSVCRILLQVEEIRAERLMDITEEDAMAEGVQKLFSDQDINFPNYKAELDLKPMPYKNYLWPKFAAFSSCTTAKQSFHTLWRAIHGPDPVYENPWVRAITFKLL